MPVPRIFDKPLTDVSVEDVQGYLDDATEEGVTWEAKADKPEGKPGKPQGVTHAHIEKTVCAFGNQFGGTMILGAAQDGSGTWSLPGVDIPGGEPESWIERAINKVRPTPPHNVKVFALDDGRTVGLIEVQPEARTPCITSKGEVFIRVSSDSVRVTDPILLAELVEKGHHRLVGAESAAEDAARTLAEVRSGIDAMTLWIAVAISALDYEPDISSRLFTEATAVKLQQLGVEHFRTLPLPLSALPPKDRDVSQNSVDWMHGNETLGYRVRGRWDGTVGVVVGLTGDAFYESLIDVSIKPAWKIAADGAQKLGGSGLARVHITVRARQSDDLAGSVDSQPGGQTLPTGIAQVSSWQRLPAEVNMKRESELRHPTDDELQSVWRELRRAAGHVEYEPGPEANPS